MGPLQRKARLMTKFYRFLVGLIVKPTTPGSFELVPGLWVKEK